MTYAPAEDVRLGVERFESGISVPDEFTHARHVAVALTYLHDHPLPHATRRMRESLSNFQRVHSLSALHHETTTVFWMRLMAHVLSCARNQPLHEVVNAAIARFGSPAEMFKHYRSAALMSDIARAQLQEPDLLSLSF